MSAGEYHHTLNWAQQIKYICQLQNHILSKWGEDGQRLVQSRPKQEGVLPRVALGVHQLKLYFTHQRRFGDVKQVIYHYWKSLLFLYDDDLHGGHRKFYQLFQPI